MITSWGAEGFNKTRYFRILYSSTRRKEATFFGGGGAGGGESATA